MDLTLQEINVLRNLLQDATFRGPQNGQAIVVLDQKLQQAAVEINQKAAREFVASETTDDGAAE